VSTFVIPPKRQPRAMYRATPLAPAEKSTGWPTCRVRVERLTESLETTEDGSDHWETVCEYDRNYSFMKTFEPFRQLRDGVWRDYALISRDYTYLEVLDLTTGETIAEEQPTPAQVQSAADVIARKPERYTDRRPEDLARTWGFCPVEFLVPDWWDANDDSIAPGDPAWDTSDERLTGEWGVYLGTVWGDDWAWKVRYVDLSRIADGEVTTDDRFGYVPLPHNLTLKQAIDYSPETDRITIPVPIAFDRESGRGNGCLMADLNLTES
jgi:hypothetical protein